MIILRPKGHFGNFLFQYAFARMISLDLGIPRIFVDRAYGGKILIDMGLAIELTEQPDFYRVIFNQISFADRIGSQISKLHPKGFSRIIQSGSSSVLIPNDMKPNVAIHGRFQSADYWKHHEQILRKEILNAIERFTDKVYTPATGRVAVHIRRGDYMKAQHLNTIGALHLDYYVRAIEQVLQRNDISEIHIFTDDAKHPDVLALKNKYNCRVRSDDWASDFFGILNSQFKIISNSTFSWWAACLSEGLNSNQVWVPDPFWVRQVQQDSDEIVPNGWNRLSPIWY
jgi:hypothetical protein